MTIDGQNHHTPQLAVCLLTYNNRNLLELFLPAIVSECEHYPEVSLWVIDNASTDDTQTYLNQFNGRLHRHRVAVNKGFTNGYAVALPHIKAEVYCLLSSDVEPRPGWIKPMLELFAADQSVGAAQPKVLSWHRPTEFEYAGAAGGFLDSGCYPFCRGRIFYSVENDHGQYDTPMEVFWASGCCFFIRASLYHQLGGLDNGFYAHMEEIDLCWRLKNAGHRVMVQPASVVRHMGGAVIAYGSAQKVFRNHRNNLLMMLKNLHWSQLPQQILVRLLLDALAFVNLLAKGDIKPAWHVVLAHWSFFAAAPATLWARQHTGQKKRLSQLVGTYSGWLVWEYFARGRRTFSQLKGVK